MAKTSRAHGEKHFSQRIGWLRAAVLGANDGIVSTASLIMGIAAANADTKAILLASVAGLVAGAMSMAAGEYVSVSSQADTEQADLRREAQELAEDPQAEQRELTVIYMQRGLDRELATQVSKALMAHDALQAHARDELGLTEVHEARPLQAAVASAAAFSAGAALPVALVALTPMQYMIPVVAISSLIFLAIAGVAAAHTGGASLWKGAVRVTLWGALAMLATAGIGNLFGTVAA